MNRAKIVAKELSLPDVGLTNGVESCRMTGSIWEVNHRIIWYGMSTLLIEQRSGEKRRVVATFRASAERDEGRRHCDSPLAIVHCARVPCAPQCHDASMLRGAPATSPKHLLRPPPHHHSVYVVNHIQTGSSRSLILESTRAISARPQCNEVMEPYFTTPLSNTRSDDVRPKRWFLLSPAR